MEAPVRRRHAQPVAGTRAQPITGAGSCADASTRAGPVADARSGTRSGHVELGALRQGGRQLHVLGST
jgi:hypothetical protein